MAHPLAINCAVKASAELFALGSEQAVGVYDDGELSARGYPTIRYTQNELAAVIAVAIGRALEKIK